MLTTLLRGAINASVTPTGLQIDAEGAVYTHPHAASQEVDRLATAIKAKFMATSAWKRKNTILGMENILRDLT